MKGEDKMAEAERMEQINKDAGSDTEPIDMFDDYEPECVKHWVTPPHMYMHAVLQGRYKEFPVPTQVVIRDREIVLPKTGRIYFTGFYLYNGKVVDYMKLKSTPSFNGTGSYPELFLVETFINCGDDGHIEYERDEYCLMTKKQVDNYITQLKKGW